MAKFLQVAFFFGKKETALLHQDACSMGWLVGWMDRWGIPPTCPRLSPLIHASHTAVDCSNWAGRGRSRGDERRRRRRSAGRRLVVPEVRPHRAGADPPPHRPHTPPLAGWFMSYCFPSLARLAELPVPLSLPPCNVLVRFTLRWRACSVCSR